MIWLETERLLFRDHEAGDLAAHCEMESDLIYRWPQVVHPRAEIERGFRERWMRPKELGLRATVFKPHGRYSGLSGLYPLRKDHEGITEAMIAFYIARPYWHRGIATEAGRAWVAHGFEKLGLRRIEAGINAANGASLRVIEKLGFRCVESGGDHGVRWHNFELINPRS